MATDIIENGQGNINTELNHLKKEMIGRIVNKMKEDKKDIFLHLGEDLVSDYLLDEGDDKVKDFFLGVGLNIFSESASQLKDIREQVRNAKTREDLENLENEIINNLNNQNNQSQTEGDVTSNESAQTVAGTSVAVGMSQGDSNLNNTPSSIEISPDSAPVGEAAEVPLKDRMDWLFPSGKPKNKQEMEKYITEIEVPICTTKGKEKTLNLRIHKKLANEYKAIFKEMYDKRIPVNPDKTGGYNYRLARKSKNLSHHSYGTAVDINWDVNGGVYGPTVENSPYYNDQETVDIRKKHGFYWGGDWSKGSNDPMHFTYMK